MAILQLCQEKIKIKNEANPAVFDLPSEPYKSVGEDEPMKKDEPMGEDKPMEEEHIQEKESDGLEEFWNEYSVALESSKLDTLEEAANEEEVDNVCNHEIQILEDLGHVCGVCDMIVRRADTIIDYQWRKASRSRSYFSEKC